MFNRMFPELHVSDCEKAARFFEHALGYTRGYTLKEEGVLDYAVMDHPDDGMQLTLHRMLPQDEVAAPRRMRLYFEPHDIVGLVQDLRAKGFTVTDPTPTDYGAVTAQLTGPDGYEIVFQQWAKKS